MNATRSVYDLHVEFHKIQCIPLLALTAQVRLCEQVTQRRMIRGDDAFSSDQERPEMSDAPCHCRALLIGDGILDLCLIECLASVSQRPLNAIIRHLAQCDPELSFARIRAQYHWSREVWECQDRSRHQRSFERLERCFALAVFVPGLIGNDCQLEPVVCLDSPERQGDVRIVWDMLA